EDVAATFPVVSSLDVSVTRTGATVGTPAYMAPEQLRGGEVSASSDQFSFCVALYEALEGVRPFAGSCIVDIHNNIETGRRQIGSGRTPKAILAIVERGLALSPADRWPSLGAMVDALAAMPGRRDRRRRTWWMGGMGVVAVSAVGVAVTPDDPCKDSPQPRVWPGSRRATLEAAVGADKTWQTLDAAVSRWSLSWTETYEASCRAAREEGRTTEAVLAEQWACLDRRERTVDALLEGLAGSGAPVLHGGDVVRSLPSLEDCGSTRAVMDIEAPPPASASDVHTARTLLDESLVATTVGDVDDAVALAEAAIRLVDKVGHVPSRVEAELRRGKLGRNLDDDRGEGRLQQAFVLAESNGYDTAAADAALQLSVVAVDLDDLKGAWRWRDVAAAKLDRIEAGPRRRAHLSSVETEIALLEGNVDAADAASRDAMRLCAEAEGDASLLCADMLSERARVVEVVGSIEDAEVAHADALQALRRLLGVSHPSVGVALLNRGIFLLEAGRFDAAGRALDESLRILESGTLPRVLVAVHLARVQLASMRGNLDVAALDPIEALLAAYPSDDPQWTEYEGVLAAFLLRAGQPLRALGIYERASSAHLHVSGPRRVEVAMNASNMGECLIELGRMPEARTRFEQALEQLAGSVASDDGRLSYPLTGLGRVLLSLGESDAARDVLERSLAIGGDNQGDLLLLAQTQWTLAQALGLGTDRGQALAKVGAENFLVADDKDSAELVLKSLLEGRTQERDHIQ
ncbi:MAG: tetratricopeptide repeat protein, partial [Nannocystaceae bacterium]|nr:tetratricopeptide repeat protein [Nannocystaceae bacterium]